MSDENDRAERLARLLVVQAQKRRLEEWRLAELQREALALAASSAAILKSLGDESLLHGLFLDAKASALKRNEVTASANRASQAKTELRLREAQGIEKRLERASSDADGDNARVAERTGLAAVLEDYLTAVNASFE